MDQDSKSSADGGGRNTHPSCGGFYFPIADEGIVKPHPDIPAAWQPQGSGVLRYHLPRERVTAIVPRGGGRGRQRSPAFKEGS